MSDNKPNYADISQHYDAARTSDRPHVEWWLQRLAEEGKLEPGRILLDLGCGTGRWTIPLVERTGCDAIGVDLSPEMLTKAREKDSTGRIQWLEGDIYRPPVPPKSCDAALLSLLLHHLEDIYVAFRAAYVSLRPGGVLMIRQGTLDQIIDDPVHRFFPETVQIELKRTPLPHEVANLLYKAGFTGVEGDMVRMRTHKTADDWLLEVEPRVMSVLRMIPDEAFERGLGPFREYVLSHPDDPWLLEESITLFTAHRPEQP
jgi:ubiquinone/menaquinone biosynthesis C-methylase UbiE